MSTQNNTDVWLIDDIMIMRPKPPQGGSGQQPPEQPPQDGEGEGEPQEGDPNAPS